MLGLSNFASREIDRKMIQEVGLPGLVLMEEAALRIYDILKDNYALEGKNVLIAAGKGNNDGGPVAVWQQRQHPQPASRRHHVCAATRLCAARQPARSRVLSQYRSPSSRIGASAYPLPAGEADR